MSAQFITSLITIIIVIHLILVACSYLIMLERKISAWIQNRIGPNRTGFSFGILPIHSTCWGLGQPLADGVKLFFKEDYTPPGVERTLFLLAPVLAVVPAMVAWAVIPWGGSLHWGDSILVVAGAPVNIGVIFILAVGSLAVYGVVLAGYASNNKYSFFGGLRATAQMLSYEIPQGLCVLMIILIWGTANASQLVEHQANGVWHIFYQPLLAMIFFTCVLAECNRAPFDLAEAEQELVGGFHTEYASMKWALFFLGEYAHMITGAAFFSLLFLGGWDLPVLREPTVGGIGWVLFKSLVFGFKTFLMLSVMMWVRWTLPRMRFDQLMRLAWCGLIPTTLVLLLANATVIFLRPAHIEPGTWNWLLLVANVGVFVIASILARWAPGGPPVNRRVALEGSRFSMPQPTRTT